MIWVTRNFDRGISAAPRLDLRSRLADFCKPQRLLLMLVFYAMSGGIGSAQFEFEPYLLESGRTINFAGSFAGTKGSSGLIVVQSDLLVSGMEVDGRRVRVVWTAELPADTFVWDIHLAVQGADPKILAVGEESLTLIPVTRRGAEKHPPLKLPEPGDLFRGSRTSAPLRRELVDPRSPNLRFLVPGLEHFELRTMDGSRPTLVLPAPSLAQESLGWGIGYRITSRMTLPDVVFCADGKSDGSGVLWRSGAKWMFRGLDLEGEPAFFGNSPRIEKTTILGFDHQVPLLSADWDGDAAADLLLSESGAGVVYVYRGAGRVNFRREEPDQILRTSGFILWRWVLDLTGDTRADLVLLNVPALNLLDQVQVFRRNSLPVRLLIFSGLENGEFSRSPTHEKRLNLPTRVALTRQKREASFLAPLAPFKVSQGRYTFFLPAEDGTLSTLTVAGDSIETTPARIAMPDERMEWLQPFVAAAKDLNQDGVADPVWIRRGTKGHEAVLYLSRVR